MHANQTPCETFKNAESEIEVLERGRAKPRNELNYNPPRKLKTIVDSAFERRREARISALKAYLEFKRRRSAPVPQYDEELGHCL
jgi:hypothetical protein